MSFKPLLILASAGTLLLSSCSSTPATTEAPAAITPTATAPAADTTTALPAAGVQYTCPMHPEVVSNKPGDCPKCGMHLVKKS